MCDLKKEKILVLGDSPSFLEEIGSLLGKEGYHTLTLEERPEKAMAIIEEEAPDLVLIHVDFELGEKGLDLGAALSKAKKTPFVYITVNGDKRSFERAIKTRPKGYLVRPLKSIDIITTVATILIHNGESGTRRLEHTVPNGIPVKIKDTIAYIQDNLQDKITVGDLAAIAGWKEEHYITNFKKALGVTPYRFVMKSKIDRAKKQLLATDIPIVDIAYDLGFQSHSNFSANFLRYVGMTPRKYRSASRLQKREAG
ncbi:helix-turn-helix domain-containing protein [Maribacter sp. 2-571]|uniref:helix-turn-helix domain-containing protein n=1 Tax=Maribacter sp. 2-571 TaxID=3417569 RepID=UPI003D32DECC